MTDIVSKSQLMYHVARGEMREAFQHDELGYFDVTAMRALAVKKGELVTVDINAVAPFVQEQRVFEWTRARELPWESWQRDPILYVRITEPFPLPISYLLIDGAHRVMRRLEEGRTTVDAYVLDMADVIRPAANQSDIRNHGFDWGDDIVNGKIVKRGK